MPIYGWLKIGSITKSRSELSKDVAKYHHHAYMFGKWKNNTIYLPQESLFNDMNIPGCGYFKTLNNSLKLSCSHLTCQARKGPSMWMMPVCFLNDPPTYIGGKIIQCTTNGSCCANTAIIGQEFVNNLQGDVLKWVKDLFTENQNNIFLGSKTCGA